MGPLIHRRTFLAAAAASAGACATGPSQRIDIAAFNVWPGDPPGSAGAAPNEEIIERSQDPAVHDRAVIHVRTPTLKVFRPARPNGAAVLVMPGGGYRRVVLDKEGDETARRLAEAGITAAVLVYRLPEDGWAAGWQAPLQDAQRSLRMLRAGRVASGVDPTRVGVLGFSAGGHLAAMTTLMSSIATYAPIDSADSVSPRPDFAALMYAAYLDGEGSPALLTGLHGRTPDLVTLVDANTHPVFLIHAEDDRTVPVEGSRRMYAALKAAGVPAELHVFPDGGHGFGIAGAKGKEAATWPDLFLRWGRTQGFFR